jgi:integrase
VSVRKRRWTTKSGEVNEAWIVHYAKLGEDGRKEHIKTFDRKKDAEAYHAEVAINIRRGTHTPESRSITVAQAGENWLEARQAAGLEPATLQNYGEHLRKHIIPLIGTVKLSALTVPFVRDYEVQLPKEGRSPTMVKRVLISLSGILAEAQERGHVAQNVVRARSANKKNGHTEARRKHKLTIGKDIPTLAEIRAIIDGLESGGRSRPFLLTAIFTGLRSSELRGLRWNDVDLARSELHVRQRADRYGKFGSPKSAAGQRNVPLLPMVVNALKEWKLASDGDGHHLVFPGEHGRPLVLTTIIKHVWHPAQVRAGVVAEDGSAKYGGLHALRHFNASWCINRRADGGLELPIKVVQGRLGHASMTMTADRYGHLFPRTNDADELKAAEHAFMAIPT